MMIELDNEENGPNNSGEIDQNIKKNKNNKFSNTIDAIEKEKAEVQNNMKKMTNQWLSTQ